MKLICVDNKAWPFTYNVTVGKEYFVIPGHGQWGTLTVFNDKNEWEGMPLELFKPVGY